MTELLDQTLASIVTGNHQSAAVFEKYNLDFCCRGKRSLQEACRENKINPASVLLDLEKIYESKDSGGDDFSAMSLQELSTYIVNTHHQYVKREMPVMLAYLQKVSSKHGERHPELLKITALFAAVCDEMEMHMMKEEKILFPRIDEVEKMYRENGSIPVSSTFISAPVSIMEQEHDHAGSMLQEIRELTSDYHAPTDACTTYKLCYAALQAFEQDLHRHVHLENNLLFPAAMKLFSRESLN